MPPERESRPVVGTTEPAQSISTAIKNKTSVTLGPDILKDREALAAQVDGAFVVVVRVNGARYRRRCYLTAQAAENAARKATNPGESVVVFMAELKPLWRIPSGSVGMDDTIAQLAARGMR